MDIPFRSYEHRVAHKQLLANLVRAVYNMGLCTHCDQATTESKLACGHAMCPACGPERCLSCGLKPVNLIPRRDDRYPPPPACFVLDNVLTKAECEEWMRAAEQVGYTDALIQSEFGEQVRNPEIRNGGRAMLDDPERAHRLFKRISRFIPSNPNKRGAVAQGLNERLRFLRYFPGEYFKPHFDNPYEDERNGTISIFTVQVYLNDDFDGGETVFLDGGEIVRPVAYRPKQGSVLVFEQEPYYHEGATVTRGVKYCVRTEVMFLG